MATTPLISLCIPTWNRAPYLRYVLSWLKRDAASFPDVEIVIADNASTDDTPAVIAEFAAHLPIRSLRHAENIGAYRNVSAALTAGTAPYVMYLADDDTCDVAKVRARAAWMAQNPGVSAAFAPWLVIDAVGRQLVGQFYQQARDERVDRGDYARALDVLLTNRIMPEMGILRADLARVLPPFHRFAYNFSGWVARALELGDVLFAAEPLYVNITRHPADTTRRTQVGNLEALDSWDRYRGGFELLFGLARRHGQLTDGAQVGRLRREVELFLLERMDVALRMNRAEGRFFDAYMVALRLLALVDRPAPDMGVLTGLAALDFAHGRAGGARPLLLDDTVPATVRDAALRAPGGKFTADPNQGVPFAHTGLDYDAALRQVRFG
jgi:glycosyltransferase involved in cell wall biosynthesis